MPHTRQFVSAARTAERYRSLDDKGPLKVQQMMCFDDRYHGFIPVKVVA